MSSTLLESPTPLLTQDYSSFPLKPYLVYSYHPDLNKIRALIWAREEENAVKVFITEIEKTESSKLKELNGLIYSDFLAIELTPGSNECLDFWFLHFNP